MKILLQKIGAPLIAVTIVVLLAACGEREAESPPPPKPYELGTVISFGKGGGSEAKAKFATGKRGNGHELPTRFDPVQSVLSNCWISAFSGVVFTSAYWAG